MISAKMKKENLVKNYQSENDWMEKRGCLGSLNAITTSFVVT